MNYSGSYNNRPPLPSDSITTVDRDGNLHISAPGQRDRPYLSSSTYQNPYSPLSQPAYRGSSNGGIPQGYIGNNTNAYMGTDFHSQQYPSEYPRYDGMTVASQSPYLSSSSRLPLYSNARFDLSSSQTDHHGRSRNVSALQEALERTQIALDEAEESLPKVKLERMREVQWYHNMRMSAKDSSKYQTLIHEEAELEKKIERRRKRIRDIRTEIKDSERSQRSERRYT